MKKGFTLIELLAVIVILAIIAVIAVPIVLNIIKDTKNSATLRSAEAYLNAVKIAVSNDSSEVDEEFNINMCNIMMGNILCDNKTELLKVNVKGEKPNSGKIFFSSNGEISDYVLNYENNTVILDKNEKPMIVYKESNNIETPDLYNNTLTPVIYDGKNWKIADVSKEWYSYENNEWANAVILNQDSNKKTGDIINVDGDNPDILGMFVWIPKYEYKIEGNYGIGGNDKTTPGEISINFIEFNKMTPSKGFELHPAFELGGMALSGIWVGKFEVSHSSKTSNMLCGDENCLETNSLRILPNQQALTNSSISSLYYGIRAMRNGDSVFNIKNNLTDTHMIKNTEWSAVAYLSQSKYGKYGNKNYKGANKEIYINNSSSYLTGRSAGNSSSDQTSEGKYKYDEELNGTGASTTGNIYGIYDMNGGALEYVMGVSANLNNEILLGNSSFQINNPINNKFYNIYKTTNGSDISTTTSCEEKNCYGHAFDETTGWYSDKYEFINLTSSWIVRGGSSSEKSLSGIFYLGNRDGSAQSNISTRVILASNISIEKEILFDLDVNTQYKPIDEYVHYVNDKDVQKHSIKFGKCSKCGETVVKENKEYKFSVVENVEELEMALVDSSNNAIYIKPGTYTLTKLMVLKNDIQPNLIGIGNSKEDVVIDAGNVVIGTQAETGGNSGYNAAIVIITNETKTIEFKNLTIINSQNSTSYLIGFHGGKLKLENVNIINNGSKTAINVNGNKAENQTILNITTSEIKNLISGSNKLAPIQIRNGVILNIMKNTHIHTEQIYAPSISIEYGSNDTKINTINIDDTLTSTHGNVEGVVIYSSTPNDKWLDVVNVNNVQLKHNDDTKKGGNSTITGWNVFDAKDWDFLIIKYAGYVYTNNQSLEPDNYLKLIQ